MKLSDFQSLRDQWALRAPVLTHDDYRTQQALDRSLNPHNDNYKPTLRSNATITSDEAYKFADRVLLRQYGQAYENWLSDNQYYKDPNGRGYRSAVAKRDPDY